MQITAVDLRKLAPHASGAIIAGVVENQALITKADINTPRRLCHFLAQVAVETGGFTRLDENLTYTTVAALRKAYGSRIKSDAAARSLLRNPEGLANLVYGGRYGNGPAASNDGWRYRGAGLLQTTFHDNFAVVQKVTGLPVVSNPDLLRTFPSALQAATIFWAKHGCNELADKDDVIGVTKAINGGVNGLSERKAYLAKAKAVWGNVASPVIARLVDIPDAPIAADVAPAVAPYDPAAVQQRLRDLGYFLVGDVDGAEGDYLADAVMSFRRINSLPLSDQIDQAFLDRLFSQAAAPRPVPEARANATKADLAHGPFFQITSKIKGTLAAVGIGSVTAPAADGLVQPLDVSKVDPTQVGGWLDILHRLGVGLLANWPFLLVALIAIAGFVFVHRAEHHEVEGYREGRHV